MAELQRSSPTRTGVGCTAGGAAAARLGSGVESSGQRALRMAALVLFPLLLGGLVMLFAIDGPAYLRLIRQDGLAENLTALHLAVA